MRRLRLFVIPASRGFAQAAAIAELLRGSENNGVPCLMLGIQKFALPCQMPSGRFFINIENSYTILQRSELLS